MKRKAIALAVIISAGFIAPVHAVEKKEK